MHPITHTGIPANMNRPMDRQPETDAAARPGKSGQSVGHMAKAAVAAAAEAGIELPSSAQGFAASAIAGGADPALIFAVQTEDPAEGGAEAPVAVGEPVVQAGAGETPPAAGAPVGDQPVIDDGADRLAAELAAAAFTAATDLIAAEAASSAETALELLSDAEDTSA